VTRLWCSIVVFACAVGCSSDDDETRSPLHGTGGVAGATNDASVADAGWPDASGDDGGDASDVSEAAPGPCPSDMQEVGEFCMDRFEAPNVAGAVPLVMYTFDESATWCEARGKRLCFDDEWTLACEGAAGTKYPYGDDHVSGTCNDDELWKVYDQSKLNGWPWTVSTSAIETLDALLDAARAVGGTATVAADHVEDLYQAEGAGVNAGCVNETQVFDLTGNIEEWTRRRDGGGGPDFSGSLKGRYWAEARTCQSAVEVHGDGFRFYEIGFRCCRDPDS
jgi:formylglycine-generating enzyme required for sulfatase activity